MKDKTIIKGMFPILSKLLLYDIYLIIEVYFDKINIPNIYIIAIKRVI